MSAKIINFPIKLKMPSKADQEKSSTEELKPHQESLPTPVKIHLTKRSDQEIFLPEYFMLVE